MSELTRPELELEADWFQNFYACPRCGTEWEDGWSCMCNDRCPKCNAEIEPKFSIDRSRSLAPEDYLGAATLIFGTGHSADSVTEEDAKDFAEAMLEGGPHRFEHGRTHAFRAHRDD
jgi:predicted  nucleic acid-binding Zn-ribbon protein